MHLAEYGGAAGFKRKVAIKILRQEIAEDSDLLERFKVEAHIGSALQHENIVQVLDFEEIDDQFLLVMEYVRGAVLRPLLMTLRRKQRVLPLPVVFDIVLQLARGLDYAHRATNAEGEPLNLIHRDLKPPNVILSASGVAKVMDFGIARVDFARTATGNEQIKGTFSYMAPEQTHAVQRLSQATDQFALGLMLCEMIIGRPVYKGEMMAVLEMARNRDLGDALERVEYRMPTLILPLSRLLAHHPAQRYGSMGEVVRTLQALAPTPGSVGLSDIVEAWLRDPGSVVEMAIDAPLPSLDPGLLAMPDPIRLSEVSVLEAPATQQSREDALLRGVAATPEDHVGASGIATLGQGNQPWHGSHAAARASGALASQTIQRVVHDHLTPSALDELTDPALSLTQRRVGTSSPTPTSEQVDPYPPPGDVSKDHLPAAVMVPSPEMAAPAGQSARKQSPAALVTGALTGALLFVVVGLKFVVGSSEQVLAPAADEAGLEAPPQQAAALAEVEPTSIPPQPTALPEATPEVPAIARSPEPTHRPAVARKEKTSAQAAVAKPKLQKTATTRVKFRTFPPDRLRLVDGRVIAEIDRDSGASLTVGNHVASVACDETGPPVEVPFAVKQAARHTLTYSCKSQSLREDVEVE